VQTTLAAGPWFAPFAVDPAGGFATIDPGGAWTQPLILAAADAARQLGRERLIIAGWPGSWSKQTPVEWSRSAGLPITVTDSLIAVQPADAVFHLGEPAVAAAYLRQLRQVQPQVPLLLGPQGEDPVLVEHGERFTAVFWQSWVDEAYPGWAANHQPATPLAYGVYRAIQTAGAITGAPVPPALPWQVQWFCLTEDGTSYPYRLGSQAACLPN
jgi:hypothetical protein